jgi:hypothetical protein
VFHAQGFLVVDGQGLCGADCVFDLQYQSVICLRRRDG